MTDEAVGSVVLAELKVALFMPPRHKMAEGHIVSYMCVRVRVCVFQNRVRAIT